MPKFIVTLSDIVTCDRVLALEIDATSEADAKQVALTNADLLMTVFHDLVDERPVETKPYKVEGESDRNAPPTRAPVTADRVRQALRKPRARR